jgi:hypothetical protein
MARSWYSRLGKGEIRQDRDVRLEQAMAATKYAVDNAPAPLSVFVADAHGEVVSAATMDGAAPDTRLNAQRKAYTAARSDATSTAALAAKGARGRGRASELRPVLHVLPGRRRGLRGRPSRRGDRRQRPPGPDDDALARRALEAAGLSTQG